MTETPSLDHNLLDGRNQMSYSNETYQNAVQSGQKKAGPSRSAVFLNDEDHHSTHRARRSELTTIDFYKQEGWFDELCEILFKIKERNTTIRLEIYYGLIHFISCLYILAVIPQQLSKAGYNIDYTVVAIGACCGVGSIVGGLFTNLPFVIAPTSVVSIFLSVYLQSSNLDADVGSAAVVLSGIVLMLLFWKPLGIFIGKLIPLPIQVGTTLGVGLLTALAGAVEIDIVRPGKYSLLEIGVITDEVIIAVVGLLIIAIGVHYHVKGAFVIALISCSLLWWVSQNAWPTRLASTPEVAFITNKGFTGQVTELMFDLIFLYILYLSGLIPTFTDLSGLQRSDGTTPRGRWFFVIAGVMTILSGLFTSAPILISPESSAGIKAGAKTGLSTFVCGLLFLLTIFFSPVFRAVPAAATSPLLMMIGIILFQDVNRINWKDMEDAAPAFVVVFFIPFTYSIINGVAIGYLVYIIMGIFTGTLRKRFIEMMDFYAPSYSNYFFHHHKKEKASSGVIKTESGTYQSSDVEASVVTSPMTDSTGTVKHTAEESAHSEHALAMHSRLSIATDKTDDGNSNNLRGVDTPSTRARNQSLFKYDREAIRSIENVNIS
jgi:adenine/guanine/hypoxanthine permease